MKKNLFTKLFLSLILLTTNACDMTKKSNDFQELSPKPIHLRDYKNIKSLEKYLNEKYPAGSDANKMIEDMEKGGAYCSNLYQTASAPDIVIDNFVFCKIHGVRFFLSYQCNWFIRIETSKGRTIKSIKLWIEPFVTS